MPDNEQDDAGSGLIRDLHAGRHSERNRLERSALSWNRVGRQIEATL